MRIQILRKVIFMEFELTKNNFGVSGGEDSDPGGKSEGN